MLKTEERNQQWLLEQQQAATSSDKRNGNDHLFNEILPPVERTFPFFQ